MRQRKEARTKAAEQATDKIAKRHRATVLVRLDEVLPEVRARFEARVGHARGACEGAAGHPRCRRGHRHRGPGGRMCLGRRRAAASRC